MSYEITTFHNEKLKLSKFNILEPIGNDILVYNTNSGGILKLNSYYKEKYDLLLQDNIIEDMELKQALLQGEMVICKEDCDEIQKVLIESKIHRFSGNSINLTIAPTMLCNFRCPYCYEKGKEYVTMNTKTVNKLKEFIKKLKEQYQYINIMWYGGEPLLAFDIVEELMTEIHKVFEKKYVSSGIVSNGYLLNDSVVSGMKGLNINNIQITIDGPPEIHNKRRRLPSGEDTFFEIVNNIKNSLDLYPELLISVRINVDKTNINRVNEIEKYFKKYGLLNRISAYVAPVTNINNTCSTGECFNVKEFALEEIKFLRRNSENGLTLINVPKKNPEICGAVSLNSWVIDAKGDFYKCWEDIGEISEKVGSVFDENFDINRPLLNWLSYSIEDDEECLQCPYLPICMGGCPNYRMKNKGKNCHPIKENANQIMRLIYDISKQGTEDNV